MLMTHDRVEGDEFELTHEFLSQMLGARRSGVTVIAGSLQRAGLMNTGADTSRSAIAKAWRTEPANVTE